MVDYEKIIKSKLSDLYESRTDTAMEILKLENLLKLKPFISVSNGNLVIRCKERKMIGIVNVQCSRIEGTHEKHEFCFNGKRYN